ncbi:MAG: ABC transporter permease subunit [Firmicutes bacterium]|nr:ABC transporter permease subunit [Bacillota bacterium]
MKKKAKGARPYLGRILVLAIYLALWTLAYRLVGQDILLASPLQVVRVLGQLVVKGEFWQSVANSLLRILLGFVLAVLAGSFLAVLTSLVPAARLLLSPALNTLKATPITSFIILALIWLRGERVAVFIAFLAVLPIIWTNVAQGIAKTDEHLLEMGRLFRLSSFRIWRYIYLPSVLPYFLAACMTGIGFAWKAGIAAEVLGLPRHSIGQHLYQAKIYLETAHLLAWTAVVVLLSVLVEYVLVNLLRKMGQKYNSGVN